MLDYNNDSNDEFYDNIGGLSDEELDKRFKEAVRIENEIKRIKGFPTAHYDHARKMPYIEYPDGRREYVGKEEA